MKIFETENELIACVRCKGKVFDAEKVSTTSGLFHKSCYNCAACSKTLEMGSGNQAPNKEVLCKSCYGKTVGIQGYGWGGNGLTLTTTEAVENNSEYHYNSFF